MQSNDLRYRCFLIGSESLLAECGEILLKQGHEVAGVVSGAKKIVRWANQKQLRVLDPADYRAALRERPFDYFFSITHLALVPEDVLALPTRGAVNFHDGPLPRYAGLNTPVWALLNGETDYAVTWHWMTPGVDRGDVLLQKPVEIAELDTAQTLNTKCFQAGIESFGELVGLLSTGALSPRPQVFTARREYSKHDRPAAACLLDWQRPAVDLARLVRALDHGRYKNPVGSAKLRVRGVPYVATEATVVDAPFDARPGTIVSVASHEVRIATGRGLLAVRQFQTTCGRALAPLEFVAEAHLKTGDACDPLEAGDASAITTLNAQWARSEAYWTRRLRQADPAAVPYLPSDARPATVPLFAEARDPLPHGFIAACAGASVAEATTSAFAAYLARVGEKTTFDLAYADDSKAVEPAIAGELTSRHVPLRLEVDLAAGFHEIVRRNGPAFAEVRKQGGYLKDLIGRVPELQELGGLADGRRFPIAVECREDLNAATAAPGPLLTLVVSASQGLRWTYDSATISSAAFSNLRRQFTNFLASLAAAPNAPPAEVEILTPAERRLIVRDWNATDVDYPREATIHALFERQVARTPDAVAVVFENRSLTYRQLNERADRLAAQLKALGVGPDRLVGVHLERSERLVTAVLGVLKAGGAYLPLDPNYPDDRLAFMIDDAQAPVIVTERETVDRLPKHAATVVRIDEPPAAEHRAAPDVASSDVAAPAEAHHLAYVIYTSGSTGKPKGVMIEHRNAVNFFAGMDERLDHDPPGTWLAVTSLSFDIHVLELLWTLTRGFKTVVHRDRERIASAAPSGSPPVAASAETRTLPTTRPLDGATSRRPMDFSLFYFSANAEEHQHDKYRLLMEGSRYADAHGFCAVWTPERHFHSFGGLYPNPAITGAAVAAITKRVHIRAGSLVSPLHHPLRIAESWSVVDNLSNGRAGVAFAAGWQPNDFVLMPQNYADAKGVMFRDLEVVRRLWRGETVEFPGATGAPLGVRILPRPLQDELPVWITTAGNTETYRQAGEIGAHILTHLLGQSVEELVGKIQVYREARAAAGFDPDAGIVSLMLHTFVGRDADQVRDAVRGPMKAYLGTSLNLLKQYAWAFPAFKRPQGMDARADAGNDFGSLSPEEQDELLEFAFLRYYETSGLFGTVDECLAMVDRLKAGGIDEIACLIDFGVPTDAVLRHLPYLNDVRRRANADVVSRETSSTKGPSVVAGATHSEPTAADADFSLPALLRRHAVTHFQCTPSLARMLLSTDDGRAATATVRNFLVGGEALPVDLARDLRSVVGGRVINMYGPTETTVWSTTQDVGDVDGPIPIGRPIANTQLYILDPRRKPLPVGVPGELYIAGDGVARGYLHRPELTAERFVHDPFAERSGARMYRTGDLARYRADGVVEFLGRTDHQVKIRGHRIELGEIEARLSQQAHVRQAVVVPREAAPGDVRLVAYFVADGAPPAEADLRAHLREKLPEYMIPQHFAALEALPLTPNGKIDRKALPALDVAAAQPTVAYAAPEGELDAKIAALWQELLGRDRVGIDENFFDIGGHSLLVVRAHRRLTQTIDVPVALTDLFRFPTIRALVAHLSGGGKSATNDDAADRAKQRKELMERRRGRAVRGS